MKKVMIIGSSGFLGKNVYEFLKKNSNDKYIVIAPSSSEFDCTSEKSIKEWFDNKWYDVVLHFGYYSSYRHSNRDASKMFLYNLRGFEMILKYSKSYGRLFYAGSGAEYDKRFDICLVNENDVKNAIPEDEYGLLKYIIGQRIENSDNLYNLRLFGIFGKYEYYPAKFISGLCAKAVCNLPLTVRQDVIFDFLYIDDFCRMLMRMIEKEELNYHTYNIVSGTKIALVDICKIVKRISGKDLPIIVCKDGVGREYTASNERFISEFGEFDYTSMYDAIKEIYDWYNSNPDMIDIEAILYN